MLIQGNLSQMRTESDQTLLRLLQRDAGLSIKDLAQRSGLSASTVWRRLQDFEAAGLITARVTLLDPEKLGLGVLMLVNVNIRDQTQAARSAFERFAETEEAVQHCLAVTGSHDYVLMVRHVDVARFERFLMDRVLAHPSVASAHSQLVLRHTKNSTLLPV
ncbi:MAG: Lrp/AsnC family transcriptional regulator [Pseudomonadota bacterium]